MSPWLSERGAAWASTARMAKRARRRTGTAACGILEGPALSGRKQLSFGGWRQHRVCVSGSLPGVVKTGLGKILRDMGCCKCAAAACCSRARAYINVGSRQNTSMQRLITAWPGQHDSATASCCSDGIWLLCVVVLNVPVCRDMYACRNGNNRF